MAHRPHQHMILDATIKYPPKDTVRMKELLVQIIQDIGMVVAELPENQSNPISWYCSDPDNRGMTAAAILTTSHITIHVWDIDDPASIHFDLYSCSDFSKQQILRVLQKEFGLISGKGFMIDRLTSEVTKFKFGSLYSIYDKFRRALWLKNIPRSN